MEQQNEQHKVTAQPAHDTVAMKSPIGDRTVLAGGHVTHDNLIALGKPLTAFHCNTCHMVTAMPTEAYLRRVEGQELLFCANGHSIMPTGLASIATELKQYREAHKHNVEAFNHLEGLIRDREQQLTGQANTLARIHDERVAEREHVKELEADITKHERARFGRKQRRTKKKVDNTIGIDD